MGSYPRRHMSASLVAPSSEPMSDPPDRRCSSCGKWKQLSEFGGRATCEPCRTHKRHKSAAKSSKHKESVSSLQLDNHLLKHKLAESDDKLRVAEKEASRLHGLLRACQTAAPVLCNRQESNTGRAANTPLAVMPSRSEASYSSIPQSTFVDRADNSFKTHRSRTTSDAAYFQMPAVSLLQDVPNIETVTHSLDAPWTSLAVENALKRKSSCLTTKISQWHRPDLLDPAVALLQDVPNIETVTHSLDVENALKRKPACLTTDMPQWHRPDLLDPAVSLLQDVPNIETVTHSLD